MPTPPPHTPAGTAPPPRLSVLVPLFQCLPLTRVMLDSLRATLPAGLATELILVDDGSTDGTRAWLAELAATTPPGVPPLRVLLHDRNRGFAASVNHAAALARGTLLLLLNNDVVLPPGWLEPLLAAHAALGDRAGVVGNVQLDAATGAVDHAGLGLTPAGKPVHLRALPPPRELAARPVAPVPAVTGACALVSRALWEQLGGLDEGYVNGGEDIDLCYRARAAGRINAVARRSVIRHHVSSAPGRKARDEHNSRRLALRWRMELLADSLAPWCRDHIARAWREPAAEDWGVTLRAVAFLAGLRRTPPVEAEVRVARAMRREFERWEQICAEPA